MLHADSRPQSPLSAEIERITYASKTDQRAVYERLRQKIVATAGSHHFSMFEKGVCNASTAAQPKAIKTWVKFLKISVESDFIESLSEADLIFFTDCGGYNALQKNMGWLNASIHREITETTKYLTDAMGPYLLMRGPDSLTIYDHVMRARLRAHGESNTELKAYFSSLKARIQIRMEQSGYDYEHLETEYM